jgi:hypothetical protein
MYACGNKQVEEVQEERDGATAYAALACYFSKNLSILVKRRTIAQHMHGRTKDWTWINDRSGTPQL